MEGVFFPTLEDEPGCERLVAQGLAERVRRSADDRTGYRLTTAGVQRSDDVLAKVLAEILRTPPGCPS